MLLLGLTILMGVAIGWSISANDAANSLGTPLGARVLKLSQAIVLISIMGMRGAYLEGITDRILEAADLVRIVAARTE
jgi:phosphate/sulfate permease